MPEFDQVLDDIHRAIDGASHAQSESHHRAAPVADGRDAVQRAFDAGAVVRVELTDALIDIIDLGPRDFRLADIEFIIHKARSGDSPQVEDDFQ